VIDGGFGGLYVTRGAGFDFDETENVFVPADEVNFAAAAGGAEVAGDLSQGWLRGRGRPRHTVYHISDSDHAFSQDLGAEAAAVAEGLD
jgi:hypothetical protein